MRQVLTSFLDHYNSTVEVGSDYGLPQLMAELARWRTVTAAEDYQHALTTYKV